MDTLHATIEEFAAEGFTQRRPVPPFRSLDPVKHVPGK